MKFRGQKVEPEIHIVEIPKNNQLITFIFKTVLDMKSFNYPLPEAPTMIKQGKRVPKTDDPVYAAQLEEWITIRAAWTFLESCKDSPGIEWETVDIQDPKTYPNVFTEIEETFNMAEQSRIMDAYAEVNSLTESKLERARENFLDQEMSLADAVSISQNVEVNNMPNGELAKG